jgi:hypothetical protein
MSQVVVGQQTLVQATALAHDLQDSTCNDRVISALCAAPVRRPTKEWPSCRHVPLCCIDSLLCHTEDSVLLNSSSAHCAVCKATNALYRIM